VRLQDTILAAALALCAPWAQAQTQAVYRCGNSYSQQPCPGGAPVAADDPRTPAEAARSGSVAAADARRADAMEKARLAQEKNAPKAVVIAPSAPVPQQAAGRTHDGAHAKPGKPDQFTAQSPAQPGEGKKKDGKDKAAKKPKDKPDV
jgi:hypothetical protein